MRLVRTTGIESGFNRSSYSSVVLVTVTVSTQGVELVDGACRRVA